MQILDDGPVLDTEIDSLGHMNVRFYLNRVDRANRFLLQKLGLNELAPACTVRRYDTYSRFRREQFAGARLQVAGGTLEVNAKQARCYFEIRNPAKDEIAATFITVSTLEDAASRQAVLFPEALTQINEQYSVLLPSYGSPRSLSLAPPRTDVTLPALEARVSATPEPGMMSGRLEATIDDIDCDADGRLREDVDLMFVMHRPQTGEEAASFGPPVMKTPDGRRFSWAMIETRAVVLGRPVAGDRLISLGADIGLGERWRQSRRWAYIADTGRLIGVNDVVGIALDLDARQSIEIPEPVRESIERSYLPDLA